MAKPNLPVPSEHDEQRLLIDSLLGPLVKQADGSFERSGGMTVRWPELSMLYAVPNGGLRSKATAGKLRAEGVRSDVPDLCLPVVRGPWFGLYVEMKRQTGSYPKPSQRQYHLDLEAQGYAVFVAQGAAMALSLIVGYLHLPKQADAGGIYDLMVRGPETVSKTRERWGELLLGSAKARRGAGVAVVATISTDRPGRLTSDV
jgi:hypothetical protein